MGDEEQSLLSSSSAESNIISLFTFYSTRCFSTTTAVKLPKNRSWKTTTANWKALAPQVNSKRFHFTSVFPYFYINYVFQSQFQVINSAIFESSFCLSCSSSIWKITAVISATGCQNNIRTCKFVQFFKRSPLNFQTIYQLILMVFSNSNWQEMKTFKNLSSNSRIIFARFKPQQNWKLFSLLHSNDLNFDILAAFWLHFSCILTAFWLHLDWILTEFLLYSNWILAAFWLHFDWILLILTIWNWWNKTQI